ncbi:M36 family metallopeptidase [Solirubrobacter soli]|uniref:M36 family metallopeptidase n=1 Tax=Solirubrobacter soli TaxID=363832 RepID=UPI0003FE5396|nr:M36 family metallopeptidase [Solirubrobacter soli]
MTSRHAFAAVALATLAFPAAALAAPDDVAMRYVREHRADLGLDLGDIAALEPPTVTTGGNVTSVRYRQAVDGIPTADSEVRVDLAPDGSVLDVGGDPVPDLAANTTPLVTAGEAVRAVQAATGSFHATPIDKVAKGATRATTYGDGSEAELALDDRRLVWRVTYRESSTAVWDAFVDARTGNVRRRVNMVKSATNAKVWENHPGNGIGGTANTVDLETNGWLTPGSTRLSGQFARTFSDLDDSDTVGPGEEVIPGQYTLQTKGGASCTAANPCSWSGAGTNWTDNREQNAVQAFYFANRFHDWLAGGGIGFDGFKGVDPVIVQTDDGAATLPNAGHINNANMLTLPDGRSPTMQMYLFAGSGFRAMNGGDDGSVLYHEYTHGLSNRLITDAAGRGALNSPQAGAMGEGWSDWYAKDFLVSQFPALNTAAQNEVDMGSYTDATPHTLRTQGLDCPVAATIACPGAGSAGAGGYTYGDFGRIDSGPEVHADGEIWAETLWDLRDAVGAVAARRLITDGMRLTPPEPSFLDARNGILLADQAAGGTQRATIWGVFRTRGMGYYATADPATGAPAQDFSAPPAAGDPRGTITGSITDAVTGARIGGAKVAINGLAAGPDRLATTTDGSGNYAITGVPARIFPSLVISAPGYDPVSVPVTVPASAAAIVNRPLTRNWAALPGGAIVTPGAGSADYADQGCGPDAALDQSQGSGWSTDASGLGKSIVVTLPGPVDVSGFEADPAEACGDDASSATGAFTIETSQSSPAGPWAIAAAGTFGFSDRHRLNQIPASAAGVRHVRLTLLSAQGGGGFFDMTEFGVHGAPAAAVQAVQTPVPTPVPTPTPTGPEPPGFIFPQRGKTTVKFKVVCAQVCDVNAQLTVDRPTAKKLGLGKKLVAGTLTQKGVKAGRTELTLRLNKKAKKALQKGPKSRTYRARIKATANYAGTAPVSRSAQVTLKR